MRKLKYPITIIDGVEGKSCSRCHEWKPLDCFGVAKQRNGLYIKEAWCLRCKKQATTQWGKDNPEKNRAKAARARAKNPEYNRRVTKQWRKQHPGARTEESRRYRKKHPEVGQRATKKWIANNYQHVLAYNQSRRAKRKNSGGVFTEQEWDGLLHLCGEQCLVCHTKSDIHRDHIIPISRGGRNVIGNLQPLCLSCNSKKGVVAIDYRPSLVRKMFDMTEAI